MITRKSQTERMKKEVDISVVAKYGKYIFYIVVDFGRDKGFKERGRREWNNNYNRRGRPPITTKSGRTIKGRGKFVSLRFNDSLAFFFYQNSIF